MGPEHSDPKPSAFNPELSAKIGRMVIRELCAVPEDKKPVVAEPPKEKTSLGAFDPVMSRKFGSLLLRELAQSSHHNPEGNIIPDEATREKTM